MCYICQYIIKENPNLSALDNYKRNFNNVHILKFHFPVIAAIAKEYSPGLIKEVLDEKNSTTTPATDNSSIK